MSIVTDEHYDRDHLNGIKDAEKALKRLQKDIPAASLTKLVNFNHTYLIITQNVKSHRTNGEFEHPEFLERFDALFVSFYIEALKNHIQQKYLYVPPAWEFAFRAAEKGKASPLKCLVLGVNAHVNNDIPQVLYETDADGIHLNDYFFVNGIIKDSIDQAIDELDDNRQLLNPKKRLFKPFYKVLMFLLILVFRRLAWRNYRLMRKGKVQRYRMELRAKRTAQFILLLPI
jgi:hypothetical protein